MACLRIFLWVLIFAVSTKFQKNFAGTYFRFRGISLCQLKAKFDFARGNLKSP